MPCNVAHGGQRRARPCGVDHMRACGVPHDSQASDDGAGPAMAAADGVRVASSIAAERTPPPHPLRGLSAPKGVLSARAQR